MNIIFVCASLKYIRIRIILIIIFNAAKLFVLQYCKLVYFFIFLVLVSLFDLHWCVQTWREHGGRHAEDVVQVLQQAHQSQDAALPHLHQGRRARHQPRQAARSVTGLAL